MAAVDAAGGPAQLTPPQGGALANIGERPALFAKMGLRLTPVQSEALTKATAAQENVAAAADAAVTAEEKAKEGCANRLGLRQLEPLLSSITLIDINFLVALGEAGGVVPRWQDVPAAARIMDADSVWRLRGYDGGGLPILVLS